MYTSLFLFCYVKAHITVLSVLSKQHRALRAIQARSAQSPKPKDHNFTKNLPSLSFQLPLHQSSQSASHIKALITKLPVNHNPTFFNQSIMRSKIKSKSTQLQIRAIITISTSFQSTHHGDLFKLLKSQKFSFIDQLLSIQCFELTSFREQLQHSSIYQMMRILKLIKMIY